MGAKAEVEVGFGGLRGGIKDLGDLRQALIGVTDASKRLDATRKGLKNLWADPVDAKGGWSSATRAQVGIAKMALEAVATQATAQANAITGPAKSSWDMVLGKGRQFRDDFQKIATATGQNATSIGDRILGTSKRLGMLPDQVQGYGRAVRSMTGDWEGAVGGMDAFQNRALKTDRTIEQLIPTAVTLADTFGVKSTAEVNKFFGTLDAGARGAKLSVEVAEHAFIQAAGMLARITGAGPQAISALTSQVVGNAKAGGLSAEMGLENVGEIGGFLSGKQRFLERKAIQKGLLKKGEHLTKGGRYTEQGMQVALEVAQVELPKFYRTKDKEELIGRMAESGLISPTGAAALLDFRSGQFKADSRRNNPADDMRALTGFLGSAAGRGRVAQASKEANDIGYGQNASMPGGGTMLEAQDAAMMGGGGKGGILLGSVNPLAGGIMAGLREGSDKAAQYEAELNRRRRGESLPKGAGWMQRHSGPALMSDRMLEESARAARGFNDVESYRGYMQASGQGAAPMSAAGQPPGMPGFGGFQLPGTPQGPASPIPVTMDMPAFARAVGAELTKALGAATLRTQSVEPPKAPAGQPVGP